MAKCFKIHRLVAEAFIPNPENKPQVNHIDGNKLNNSVENLEWVTHSENIQHAFDTGLANALVGTNNSLSKLTNEQVLFIRQNYGLITKRKLATMFNVGMTTIHSVAHRKSYFEN